MPPTMAWVAGIAALIVLGVCAHVLGAEPLLASVTAILAGAAAWALVRLRERTVEVARLRSANDEVERSVEQRSAELQEATARLSDTLYEIQALDRAKTDFFNNVSH